MGISPTNALAILPRIPAESANTSAIPANESFHDALHAASSEKADSPSKIAGVAKQFEALMVGQMMKAAREASGGNWLGSGDDQEDQTGSMMMDLAEQGFSQAIAARGGLGIAKMVTASLERHAKTPSSDSETPAAQVMNTTNTLEHATQRGSTGPAALPALPPLPALGLAVPRR